MMRQAFFIFITMVLLIDAGRARAVTAVLAHGDAPRPEQWETLNIGVDVPPGGAMVGVRDARGGLMVCRSVQGAAGDTTHLWMPLPFLEASQLPNGEWPLDVTVTPIAGSPRTERVAVRRPVGESRTFRVAIVDGARPEQHVPWSEVTPLPVVLARVPAAEVLSGPPLEFAGFDALLLSGELQEKMDEARALDLLSTGVRLLVIRDGAALGIARLPWAPVKGSLAWIVPREPLRRPEVLEPALASPVFRVDVRPSIALRLAIIGVAPVGIILVLIARGLFRRRAWVLGGAAVGLAALAGVAVVVCQQVATPSTHRAEWSDAAADGTSPDAMALSLTETVKLVKPLVGQRLSVDAPDRAVLYPMAASAADYFAWRDARLSLDGDAGNAMASGFSLAASARSAVVLLARSSALRHITSADGWLIEDGYVTPMQPEPSAAPADRRLLTEWAADHPHLRPSLLAWYDLRYQSGHRYLLHAPAADAPDVVLDDRGPARDDRSPP